MQVRMSVGMYVTFTIISSLALPRTHPLCRIRFVCFLHIVRCPAGNCAVCITDSARDVTHSVGDNIVGTLLRYNELMLAEW